MLSRHSADAPLAEWRSNGCPVCGSRIVEDFFNVPSIPVDAGACFPTEQEALKAPMGRICQSVCHDCGYIGNRAFDYSSISFGTRYDISLHHSPVFQNFLVETAQRLIDTYKLHNKTVLEIACGTGHFLRLICQMGGNRGIGIDPSVPCVGMEPCGDRDITFIRDLYTEKYAHLGADLICCSQMFNLLPQPLDFLRMVRRNIGVRQNVVVSFEVPNAEYMYGGPIQWNVFFEHASLFCMASLKRIFTAAGFVVVNSRPCYVDDQYIYVDAVPAPDYVGSPGLPDPVSKAFLEKVRSFSARYRDAETTWRMKIEDLMRSGKKVVGWGAGGRAVFFLNVLDTRKLIEFVVDINPNRQHAYLPGTGQKIVPPEFLLDYKPDVIIITHSTYVEEITNQVRGMGLQSEILAI